MAEGWEQTDSGGYRKMGPAGQIALVAKYSSGWDASVRYASGTEVRAPHYYTSKASAIAWADREMSPKLKGLGRIW